MSGRDHRNLSQIKKYESFVNTRLRPDLQSLLDKRDKVYETISDYLKLRNQIDLLQTQNLTSLKTRMDVGCEFFMHARIPDISTIYVSVGAGYHVQMTLPEALAFIEVKERGLLKVADTLTESALRVKAQIKMVLEVIGELLEGGSS
ncbi:Prefoldin subunit-domain-containing protein [Phlyctochytrium arcticum]|nr:Prefoldin subunit-domain-containing protein [Phlyctochytrium arcticum]